MGFVLVFFRETPETTINRTLPYISPYITLDLYGVVLFPVDPLQGEGGETNNDFSY